MFRRNFTSGLCGTLLLGALSSVPMIAAQQPDNTRVNQQDRHSDQPTADQGKNNLTDRQLAAKIRRDVVKDKSLSTYGHNVKIVSDHGKVTLRGPVHSDDEKKKIEDYARKSAGDGNVSSELTVKGDEKK